MPRFYIESEDFKSEVLKSEVFGHVTESVCKSLTKFLNQPEQNNKKSPYCIGKYIVVNEKGFLNFGSKKQRSKIFNETSEATKFINKHAETLSCLVFLRTQDILDQIGYEVDSNTDLDLETDFA